MSNASGENVGLTVQRKEREREREREREGERWLTYRKTGYRVFGGYQIVSDKSRDGNGGVREFVDNFLRSPSHAQAEWNKKSKKFHYT